MRLYENIIIGAGQAGLSVAYYFRRYNIDYLILDQEGEAVPRGFIHGMV